MSLTVDSSIIVASLVKEEKHHDACKRLMDKIFDAKHTAIMPYSVLVEVVASVKRRTNSYELAENAGNGLQNTPAVYFLGLTKERAIEAADIAKETGLKGMDAIVVQVAKENGSKLITLDDEMIEKSENIADVIHIDNFEASNIDNE